MKFLASSWVTKGGACGKNKHHSRKSSSHSRVDKLEASHLGSSSLWIILTKSISSVLPTLEIVSVTTSLSCRTSSCYSVLVGMLNIWLSIMHVWLCKSACDMIYGHVCEMCWCKCCMQWKILNSAISLSTHNTFPESGIRALYHMIYMLNEMIIASVVVMHVSICKSCEYDVWAWLWLQVL